MFLMLLSLGVACFVKDKADAVRTADQEVLSQDCVVGNEGIHKNSAGKATHEKLKSVMSTGMFFPPLASNPP